MNNQDEVTTIYECYKRAMASVGYNIQLPADTNPDKTYAFRAIKKFIHQTKQWNLNTDITRALVREVVLYGKQHGLLRKGTALLNMKSVITICHNYLANQVTRTNALVVDITRTQKFIDHHIINGDIVGTLVTKINRDGYSNLVLWYRSGDISISFISISSNCRRSLNLLSPDERANFPSDEKLVSNRIKILKDNEIKSRLVNILGSDLLKIGP